MCNNNKSGTIPGEVAYLHEDKLRMKAKEYIAALKKHGIKSQIAMVRDYMLKLSVEKEGNFCGNLIIDYKATKDIFSVRTQELKDRSIEDILLMAWEKTREAGKYPESGKHPKVGEYPGTSKYPKAGEYPEASKYPEVGKCPETAKYLETTAHDEQCSDEPQQECECGEHRYEIYVDGSFIEDTIGYGVVILKNGKLLKELSGIVTDELYKGSRQVGGEIVAVIEALAWCKRENIKKVLIYYDFENLKKWVDGEYSAKIPMTRSYVEYVLNSGIDIEWKKVTGHSGVEFNERADELAKKGVSIGQQDLPGSITGSRTLRG